MWVWLRFVTQKTNLLKFVTINTWIQNSNILTESNETKIWLETIGQVNQENLTDKKNSSVSEFSINDNKYEISLESTENLFEWFTAYAFVENTDSSCMMDDPETENYKNKLTYYTNILDIIQNNQSKTYLVKNTTLEKEYEKNPSMYGWYGIHVYILPNKIGYSNKEDFIKDFTWYCSISPRIPIAISKDYLIFSDSCDNWAIDVLGCDWETIDDLRNKIMIN